MEERYRAARPAVPGIALKRGTGRPGRATLVQRRRTATSAAASAQPLRRWLRARSQGVPSRRARVPSRRSGGATAPQCARTADFTGFSPSPSAALDRPAVTHARASAPPPRASLSSAGPIPHAQGGAPPSPRACLPRPPDSAHAARVPSPLPEEIRSCIPLRDLARPSGRVVATGRPGRATLLQRRRTATSVSASSQTSLSVIAQPLRRWLRARSQGAPVAATCGLAAPVDSRIVIKEVAPPRGTRGRVHSRGKANPVT